MGGPGAPNGPNSKNFVFGPRDFIFTQYVPFYVRKSLSIRISDLGPLFWGQGAPNGPNSKNFVFGRGDSIFAQYVTFHVRKS